MPQTGRIYGYEGSPTIDDGKMSAFNYCCAVRVFYGLNGGYGTNGTNWDKFFCTPNPAPHYDQYYLQSPGITLAVLSDAQIQQGAEKKLIAHGFKILIDGFHNNRYNDGHKCTLYGRIDYPELHQNRFDPAAPRWRKDLPKEDDRFIDNKKKPEVHESSNRSGGQRAQA